MLTWASISTIATILALTFGIVRWVQARRKAKVDRELGKARATIDAQNEGLGAAEERIRTDAAIVRLPDGESDKRLDKWMRD